MSVPLELREQATPQEIGNRYGALGILGRYVLEKYPEVTAVVFVGSVVFDSEPEDTDIILLVNPAFMMTREEVDGVLYTELVRIKGEEKVQLGTHTDTVAIIKDENEFDLNRIFIKDGDKYGQFVISRIGEHFTAPLSERH